MSRCPVFLVGAPRSGTTLLAEMLNANCDVFVFNETVFYDALVVAKADCGNDREKLFATLVEHLCGRIDARLAREEGGRKEFGSRFPIAEAEKIKSLFRKRISEEVKGYDKPAQILQTFMEVVASVKGKSVWGEKTPNHLFHLKEILADFPEAKVINVVRNPWDFLISYKFAWRQRGGKAENQKLYHPFVTSLLWRKYVKGGQWLNDSGYARQCITVRYEDIVADPVGLFSRVYRFLGIEEVVVDGLVEGSNTSFGGRREKLTPLEVHVCSSVCGALAERLGYETRKKTLSFLALLVSLLSLPHYVLGAVPVIRKRFGGSILRYLVARGVAPK